MCIDRKTLLKDTIWELIFAFNIKGQYLGYSRIDLGHINDTFVLNMSESGKPIRYVIQRINTTVFKNTEALINNIAMVTAHLQKEIKKENGTERNETLHILPESGGEFYYVAADAASYRIYDYVEDSVCYQSVPDAETFKQSAIAFARFEKYLAGFPTAEITDSIPEFHNTRKRFNALTEAVKNGIPERIEAAKEQIDYACKREKIVDKVVNLLSSGGLPVRVTHNDTKLNNVLFDAATGKAVCVIDLDTIMKGSLLYDFGDSIRFGCNTAAEDERDLTKVNFDFKRFTAYSEGYLSVLAGSITQKELELLGFSGILMTYECGIRFLADYLTGDGYFKTDYPVHNLVRAKNQFKLVFEMENKLAEMNEAIVKIAAGYKLT